MRIWSFYAVRGQVAGVSSVQDMSVNEVLLKGDVKFNAICDLCFYVYDVNRVGWS